MYLYHEMGHSIDKLKANIGVDVYLKEGIYSRAEYRRMKRLGPSWEDERKEALRDEPALLDIILTQYNPERGWEGSGLETEGRREALVFFGWHKTPSQDRDWVVIDCDPDKTLLHDASCRDRNDPTSWRCDAVSVNQYIEYHKKGVQPPRWHSYYNEAVFVGHVAPDKILGYAKLEKTLSLPTTSDQIDLDDLKLSLETPLRPYSLFGKSRENVYCHVNDKTGLLEIRVAFNKTKALLHQNEIKHIIDTVTEAFIDDMYHARHFSP